MTYLDGQSVLHIFNPSFEDSSYGRWQYFMPNLCNTAQYGQDSNIDQHKAIYMCKANRIPRTILIMGNLSSKIGRDIKEREERTLE